MKNKGCGAGEGSRNKTFIAVERRIQRALQKLKKAHPGKIPVKQITDECEISEKAFYVHHSSVNEGILTGEDDLVKELLDYIEKRLPRGAMIAFEPPLYLQGWLSFSVPISPSLYSC